jgi:hypothetical protein
MNWDAVGAIAELVGALGVVASLAYLAIQIRQSTAQSRVNTTAIESSAFQQLLDHHSLLNLRLVDDPGLLKLSLSVDEASLDPLEEQRFIVLASLIFRSLYNAWCLFEKGLVSKEQWELFEAGARRIVTGRHGRKAWKLRSVDYPQRFVDAIDKATEE